MMTRWRPSLWAMTLLSACAARPAPRPVPNPRPAPAPPATVPAVDDAPTSLTEAQKARDAELAPRAAAVLGAYSNYSASLDRAGNVVFLSTRDGLPQLYAADARRPGAPARKLASPPERVAGFTLLSDDGTLVYRADAGADGNFHVFRTDVRGSPFVDLTPAPVLHRDRVAAAREMPGVFAYSAHAVAAEKTDVFLQKADGGAPRVVHSDPRGGVALDVSPDAAHVLFVRTDGDDDMTLFEVDVAGKPPRRLFPPAGTRAPVQAAVYSRAGERVLVATQGEGRPSSLIAFDRASGNEVARYEETLESTGVVSEAAVSPRGERVAVEISAGNHSALRVLDGRLLTVERTIETKLGLATLDGFSPDGARLLFTSSSPDAPRDVYAADASTGAVARLRDEPRPALASLPKLDVSIVKVESFDGTRVPVNVYVPAGATRAPVIVLVHGGPTGSAFVSWDTDVRFFASLGYVVVAPNVRGSTGFGLAYMRADDKGKRGDALRDVERVNAWARAQPWCDPDRLVIMGTSYGGYMTLLALARQPTLWRAGVDLSGMSDLRTMERLEDQAIRVYDETEFGALGKEDALLWAWSPMKDVGAIAAPAFIYQGVNDPVTPKNEADQIVRALRLRRVPVEYMVLANEGHGIVRVENRVEYLARAARFLEEHAGPR